MKDFIQGWTLVAVGVVAGVLIAHIFPLNEEREFMQKQKSACESELPADRECVLIFEYVEVEK